MTDERLAEIEARHHPDEDYDTPYCAECSVDPGNPFLPAIRYPCDAVQLVVEVRRLRAELSYLKACQL